MSLVKRKTIDPAKAELRRYYREDAGIKKSEAQQTTDEREERQESERDAKVRKYVFARERGMCRCCRKRVAESRHELRFRSLGGKVTRENCVAVCGSGTTGCHGFLQDHGIAYAFDFPSLGAEAAVIFTPTKTAAQEWMQIGLGESISSPPMVETESVG